MPAFKDYARYYNLLYLDKDYSSEADYIEKLIKKYHPSANSILDLGCGTGVHDFLLAEKGYAVTGVDSSKEMLSIAKERLELPDSSKHDSLNFHCADIRKANMGISFDVIVSLFHVISYQPTNKDLLQTFETAATHLKNKGIFIFDCWYGPGVLTTLPDIKEKSVEDELNAITRIARPVMHLHENLVDVHYHFTIRDKEGHQTQEFYETHRLRYLFKPEIEFFLEVTGFELECFYEFMKEQPPEPENWNACFLARKK